MLKKMLFSLLIVFSIVSYGFSSSFCVIILSLIAFFVTLDLFEDSFADLMNVSVIRKKYNEKENKR